MRRGRPRPGGRRAAGGAARRAPADARSRCCSRTGTSTTRSASPRSATATTCRRFIHPDDRAMLADPLKGHVARGARVLRRPAGRCASRARSAPLTDGAPLELAGLALRVDHTPGHTRGSVVFSTATEEGVEVILAGDTLFAGSIGRTDLPGGDTEQMMAQPARQAADPRRRHRTCCPGTARRRRSGGSGRRTRSCRACDVPGAGGAGAVTVAGIGTARERTGTCRNGRLVRRAQGRPRVLPAGVGGLRARPEHAAVARPTGPATA